MHFCKLHETGAVGNITQKSSYDPTCTAPDYRHDRTGMTQYGRPATHGHRAPAKQAGSTQPLAGQMEFPFQDGSRETGKPERSRHQ